MAHHDLVVIGTGSGNSIPTPELAGVDIAIVEDGAFGGTCLNVGCIPTKMFVVPAERVLDAAEADRLGVHHGAAAVDWPAMRDRIFGRIDPIAADGERYRRGQAGVSVYGSRARFVGPRTLALADGRTVSGDRVVVAAGSRPTMLRIAGLDRADPGVGVHTSDTIMRLHALPPRMVVIGGGFVGCEFASIFAALGVDVTQLQRSSVLLRAEEPAVAQRYTDLARARYDVRTQTTIAAAERVGGTWRLALADGTGAATGEVVTAEVVLVATGRRPNTDTLDCAAGGIEVDDAGFVRVDDQLRTGVDGVWALGDIATRHQLKHVANHHARVVSHNLAVDLGRVEGPARTWRQEHVPHAVFGHPQVASFGPTAAQLDAAGTAYVTARQEYGDIAYGWALEDTTGFLVVHASPGGEVIGAHAIGPHAATVIQPLLQAAAFGQHAHAVARGQYWIHPALSEVTENALLALPLHH